MMATLTTKYSVGDKVFLATTTTTRKQRPCPDCLGSRKWKAVAASGREYEFTCPRCSNGYRSYNDISLDYTEIAPHVRPLTIGSVRVDTASSDRPVEYMCVETGIGSGNLYRESEMFSDEASALIAAKLKAAEQNAETPWIVEQWNRALEISDYQLSDAIKEASDKARINWDVRLGMLFDDLREAEDIDGVKRVLDRFSEAQ